LRAYDAREINKPLAAQWDVPSTRTALPRLLLASNGDGSATFLRGEALNEFALKYAQRPHGADTLAGSVPVVVGSSSLRPHGESERKSYDAFARVQRNRKATVYVIAADGMLRGFDSATGAQTLGFAPASLLTGSPQSADDAGPAHIGAADAFFSNAWHSVIVGANATTVFALDVTNPVPTGNPLLWEFGQADGLQRFFTQPIIAKLASGGYATIFGSSERGDGEAALYVLDMATGKSIRKFAIPGDNAGTSTRDVNVLAAPAAVNIDRDDAIELIYMGDRHGNLWKLDLSAPVPEDWHLAADEQPIFRAQDAAGRPQAIVTRPEVTRGPTGKDLLVLFGAGSPSPAGPLESGATFYAAVDGPGATSTRSSMQRMQIFEYESAGPDGSARARSVVPASKPSASNVQGWYLDLPSQTGEHFATQPIVIDAKLVFGTQQAPSSACLQSVSWTFVLDPTGSDQTIGLRAGSALPSGTTDPPAASADATRAAPEQLVSAVATLGTAPSSLASPSIVETVDAQGECALLIFPPMSATGTSGLIANCRDRGARGRQSWRQLL
jgi:type IV pilus assembly protein PilY1